MRVHVSCGHVWCWVEQREREEPMTTNTPYYILHTRPVVRYVHAVDILRRFDHYRSTVPTAEKSGGWPEYRYEYERGWLGTIQSSALKMEPSSSHNARINIKNAKNAGESRMGVWTCEKNFLHPQQARSARKQRLAVFATQPRLRLF